MAANQLLATMPFLTLDNGCTVTVEAISPTTGAAVTGVTISDFTVYAFTDSQGTQLVSLPPLLAVEALA